MSILENVVNTTKNVATTVGEKTDTAIRISKLKVKISQLNYDVKGKYEKLGQLCYEAAKSGEKDEEKIDAIVADIDELKEKIAEGDKQLDELRGKLACPNCGSKTDIENDYCPKCGTKLPEKPAPEDEEPAEDADIDFEAEDAPVIKEDKDDE